MEEKLRSLHARNSEMDAQLALAARERRGLEDGTRALGSEAGRLEDSNKELAERVGRWGGAGRGGAGRGGAGRAALCIPRARLVIRESSSEYQDSSTGVARIE